LDSAGLGVRRAVGFVAPALVLIGVFLVFPTLWTLYIGITNYQLTGPAAADPRVVGLDNVVDAVRDPLFTNSVAIQMDESRFFRATVAGDSCISTT